jgi:hypothetical protein
MRSILIKLYRRVLVKKVQSSPKSFSINRHRMVGCFKGDHDLYTGETFCSFLSSVSIRLITIVAPYSKQVKCPFLGIRGPFPTSDCAKEEAREPRFSMA